ncbi:MAG: hypothetical protein ACOY93_08535 [Bacillota bacterium]
MDHYDADWFRRLPPPHQLIERLLDHGHCRRAAEVARQARDGATDERTRRRYHGLYLFSMSRMTEPQRAAG